MNKRTILCAMVIVDILLGGCGKQLSPSKETPIYYVSWLNGKWKNIEVETSSHLGNYIHESWEVVHSQIGETYDISKSYGGALSGGVVPIRDSESQIFFHGDVNVSDLEMTGNYYTMLWIDTEEPGWSDTCFIIKEKKAWLVWKRGLGVYRLQQMRNDEEQKHAYDEKLSFEENIKIRMEEQGIRSHWYYSNVWSGNWTIEEVIYTDDITEAQTHIGDIVSYHDHYYGDVNYFDLNFIESGEDRVFYRMPTIGDLGLDGAYYLLLWDEDNDYPAAIVKSEHEMFLIQGNNMYRAVQEEEYLDEAVLQGL